MEEQVKSKQRVADHGEVLTGSREVNAMLDLVKQETERIESRFLEPACGTGNFLAAILERKLDVVARRYGRSQSEYERNAILAVSSIYGIDILEDNVQQCRQRLFGIFDLRYLELFANKTKDECRKSVRFVLGRNIIHGDALSLQTVGENPSPIVFSEWSPVGGNLLKRRDFTFEDLIAYGAEPKQLSLFPDREEEQLSLFSDTGKPVLIPTPIEEFPPIHFLKLGESANGRE